MSRLIRISEASLKKKLFYMFLISFTVNTNSKIELYKYNYRPVPSARALHREVYKVTSDCSRETSQLSQ